MNYIAQMLGENEQVVLRSRQSWVVLLREALINLLIALVIIALTLAVTGGIQNQLGLLVLLLLLIPIGRFVWDLIRWWNREYIVTNRRVIQIEGTLNKHVIDSSLEKVNDVKMEQSLMGRMFGYGDVEILTASDIGVNLFKRINAPVQFKTAMLDAKDKLETDRSGKAEAAPDIPTMIAQLDNLRKQGVLTEEEFAKKKAELLAKL